MKINIHSHTIASDGKNTMLQMAEAAHKLEHCALVVTDHDYEKSTNMVPYYYNRAEVKHVQKLSPIPIIVGAEINTPFGELLLFGKSAIFNWYKHKYGLKQIAEFFDLGLWVHAFKENVLESYKRSGAAGAKIRRKKGKHHYALVMPHPAQGVDYDTWPESFWEILHGFEIANSGYATNFEVVKKLKEKLDPCGYFKSSDAHDTDDLKDDFDYIDRKIKDETDLINWIRSGKKDNY